MIYTAEQFAERRGELSEDGRWTELIAGEVVQHAPPEALHGTAVLNLSKSLAEHRQNSPDIPGATCFDQAIVVCRQPDSVFVPAVAVIPDVGPFDLADQFLAKQCPALVVEIVSTADRRTLINSKVEAYLEFGVNTIWIVDQADEAVLIVDEKGSQSRRTEQDLLTDDATLPGFAISVSELFKEPEWWSGSSSR